jgi:hypothetical protein
VAELLDDGVEELEAQVVDWPRPMVLENVGEIRSTVLQFQRALTRRVISPFSFATRRIR